MNMSPIESCLYKGPKTSTPITLPEVKLDESRLDGLDDELNIDLLDDSTVEHLLPLVRQILDEYSNIEKRRTVILEKIGVSYPQLSDEAKTTVDSRLEHQKALGVGSTAANAVIHAMKQMERFSKNRQFRKMKEDASKLSQMLAEETLNLEITKQKYSDVIKIVENEKFSLEKMQSESKPPTAIQKKKRMAELLEAKIEKLQLGEATPEACMVELKKRAELEKEMKVFKEQLKGFCDLPPDIADAEKVLHSAKKKVASLKEQLKALY